MKKILSTMVAIGLVAGCMEEDGGGVSGAATVTRGNGTASGGGALTATHRAAADGTGVVTLQQGAAFTCTARFDEVPVASGRESSPINCTNGNNGTAVLRYGDTGVPRLMSYSLGLNGNGTVNF